MLAFLGHLNDIFPSLSLVFVLTSGVVNRVSSPRVIVYCATLESAFVAKGTEAREHVLGINSAGESDSTRIGERYPCWFSITASEA